MRGAAIVLVLYATSMLFYGALEMTHDFLHYLSEHHLAALHSHEHNEHHTVLDHEHHHDHDSHVSHHHEDDHDEDQTLPSFVTFFLFVQNSSEFRFFNSGWQHIILLRQINHAYFKPLPVTPPPEI
jgi:hypothetical protein